MKRFHHIIAAVDFTPSCRVALKEAIHRASVDNARVTVVHVMDEFLLREVTRALSTTKEKVLQDWQERLRKFVDDSDIGGGSYEAEVRVGNPILALTDACKEHKADLLVVGAKGSRNEPHRIGVVASKCIRSVPVDVLVVRQEAPGPFQKVLASVDFSENSAKAVQCALHIAQQDKSTVDCLHVFQSAMAMAIDYGGFSPVVPNAVDADGVERWKGELHGFLEPLTRKVEGIPFTETVVERVNVREAILDRILETKADLVVLGTRGKSNLRTLLIGTTAERIVQHVPCSILAVKPDEIVDSTLAS